MVGERVFRNYQFLRRLREVKSAKERRRILRGASNDEILALVEIPYNILRFRFPLSSSERRRLARYKTFVRDLARKRSEKKARHILVQTGRGPIFAALLAPVLAEVASQLISRLK